MLQHFECDCGAENDDADKCQMPRVGQIQKKSQNRVATEALNSGKMTTSYHGSILNGGQCRKNDEGKTDPGGSSYYLLLHSVRHSPQTGPQSRVILPFVDD